MLAPRSHATTILFLLAALCLLPVLSPRAAEINIPVNFGAGDIHRVCGHGEGEGENGVPCNVSDCAGTSYRITFAPPSGGKVFPVRPGKTTSVVANLAGCDDGHQIQPVSRSIEISLSEAGTITLTAHAPDGSTATASYEVRAEPWVDITIVPNRAQENAGPAAITAAIARGGTDYSQPLTVTLAPSMQDAVTVPSSLTIPANVDNASCYISVIDDPEVTGDKTVVVTASASGYLPGDDSLVVVDKEETGALAFALGEIACLEGDDAGTVTLTVTRQGSANTQQLIVNLTSSDGSVATVPPTIELASGQSAATFTASIGDDALYTADRRTIVSASGAGYSPAFCTLTRTDNDPPPLALGLSAERAFEGSAAITGTVTRPDEAGEEELVVALQSSDTGEATVPATITLPAGYRTATFAISAVADNEADGDQEVTLSASATGYQSATATFTVVDQVPGTAYLTDGDGVSVPAEYLALGASGRRQFKLVVAEAQPSSAYAWTLEGTGGDHATIVTGATTDTVTVEGVTASAEQDDLTLTGSCTLATGQTLTATAYLTVLDLTVEYAAWVPAGGGPIIAVASTPDDGPMTFANATAGETEYGDANKAWHAGLPSPIYVLQYVHARVRAKTTSIQKRDLSLTVESSASAILRVDSELNDSRGQNKVTLRLKKDSSSVAFYVKATDQAGAAAITVKQDRKDFAPAANVTVRKRSLLVVYGYGTDKLDNRFGTFEAKAVLDRKIRGLQEGGPGKLIDIRPVLVQGANDASKLNAILATRTEPYVIVLSHGNAKQETDPTSYQVGNDETSGKPIWVPETTVLPGVSEATDSEGIWFASCYNHRSPAKRGTTDPLFYDVRPIQFNANSWKEMVEKYAFNIISGIIHNYPTSNRSMDPQFANGWWDGEHVAEIRYWPEETKAYWRKRNGQP